MDGQEQKSCLLRSLVFAKRDHQTMKYFLPDRSIYFNVPSKKAQHPLLFPFLFRITVTSWTRRPHTVQTLRGNEAVSNVWWGGRWFQLGERIRGSETLDKLRGQSSGNLRDVSVFHEVAGLFPRLLRKVFCRAFPLTLQGKCLKADCNMTSILPYSRL